MKIVEKDWTYNFAPNMLGDSFGSWLPEYRALTFWRSLCFLLDTLFDSYQPIIDRADKGWADCQGSENRKKFWIMKFIKWKVPFSFLNFELKI